MTTITITITIISVIMVAIMTASQADGKKIWCNIVACIIL